MSQKPDKIEVTLKYKENQQQFAAEPQEAWLLLSQFFKDFIPCFDIAQKLCLTIDLRQLALDLEGIAAFSSDGICLMVPKNRLTDNEALQVWLSAYYLGSRIGLESNDALSKDDLQVKLGKSSKITSTRLGELAKNGVVQKTADEKFRITVFGVAQTEKDILPKIKQKLKQ